MSGNVPFPSASDDAENRAASLAAYRVRCARHRQYLDCTTPTALAELAVQELRKLYRSGQPLPEIQVPYGESYMINWLAHHHPKPGTYSLHTALDQLEELVMSFKAATIDSLDMQRVEAVDVYEDNGSFRVSVKLKMRGLGS